MSIQTLKQKSNAIHSRRGNKLNHLVSAPCCDNLTPSLKMTGVSCSANVKRKLRQQPVIIKPVDCGNNLSANHSQGAYIQFLKGSNMCQENNQEDKKDPLCLCPKNTLNIKGKDPMTYAEYIENRRCKDPTLNPFRMKIRIGKLSCGNNTCC